MPGKRAHRQARGGSFASRVLPGLFYLVAIFVGGSLPSGGGPAQVSDKTLHFVVFLPFSILVARAFSYYWPGDRPLVRCTKASAFASLIGGLLELWQFLLPHRSCEFLDWVADSGGALWGVALILAVGLLRDGSARAGDAE